MEVGGVCLRLGLRPMTCKRLNCANLAVHRKTLDMTSQCLTELSRF